MAATKKELKAEVLKWKRKYAEIWIEENCKELKQLRKWKHEQEKLDDIKNRGNKDRVIKTQRGDYYDHRGF